MLNFRRVWNLSRETVTVNMVFYDVIDETSWTYKKVLFMLRCWAETVNIKQVTEIATQWKNLIYNAQRFVRKNNSGYKFTSFCLGGNDRQLTVNTVESLLRFDKNDLSFSTFKWQEAFYQLLDYYYISDFEATFHKDEQTFNLYIFMETQRDFVTDF